MPNMSLKKNPMPSQEPDVRNKNFLEVALGYTADIAVDEAQRCLHCKAMPCVSGCPVNIDIPALSRRSLTVTLRALTALSPSPAPSPQSAVVYAPRRTSARASA